MIENYAAFQNRSGFFLHLLAVGIYCTTFTNLKFHIMQFFLALKLNSSFIMQFEHISL
jgi:hypothetical protein